MRLGRMPVGRRVLAPVALGLFVLMLSPGAARAASPVQVDAISVGSNYTCAVLPSDQAVCWGENTEGQLGDGTTGARNIPTPVGGLDDATAISAAFRHTCALRESGQAVCWGYNGSGQLGDGTETPSVVPAPVSGLDDAVAISTGDHHTCAIRESSQAVCWGHNGSGQLGDGTVGSRAVPALVSGLDDAVAISASGSAITLFETQHHSCAIDVSGQALCWGGNGFGQLGDGTAGGRTIPVPVSGLDDAVAISTGDRHTCAIRESGQAVCWGYNGSGELGNGTNANSTIPVPVSGLTDAVEISVGSRHSCAIRESGQAVCWGWNFGGILGDGTGYSSTTPVSVSGLGNASAIGAGYLHSCAVRVTGVAVCWGTNFCGQLGDGTFSDRLFPSPVLDFATIQSEDCVYEAEPPPEPGKEPKQRQPGKSTRFGTFVAELVRGVVRIRPPSTSKYRRLKRSERIPVGTFLNARDGRVRIISTTNRVGGTRDVEFYGGFFRILQDLKPGSITKARLVGGLACTRKRVRKSASGRSSRRAKRGASGRLLWGEGEGKHSLIGSLSSAEVLAVSAKNTRWLVHDRCDGSTLTRVVKGKVRVRDFARKRTVLLRKGQRYVASPWKGARR